MDFPSSLPSEKKPGEDKSPKHDSSYEEDLVRHLEKKTTELSTFLTENTPSVDTRMKSSGDSSPRDFSASPNPPNIPVTTATMSGGYGLGMDPYGDFGGITGSTIKGEPGLDFDRVSPNMMDFGYDTMSATAPKDTSKPMSGIPYDEPSRPAPTLDSVRGSSPGKIDSLIMDERTVSPKLPDEPCLGPSPAKSQFEDVLQFGGMSGFHEEKRMEPEIAVCPKGPTPTFEQHFEPELKSGDHEYTRRETKTFETEESLFSDDRRGGDFGYHGVGGMSDLKSSPFQQREAPPPVPKHAYEIHEEMPPPIPKHADEFMFSKNSMEPPVVHKLYQDEEYDDESLHRSHKLSDSLEVLKESPQKEIHMEDSLLDVDEFSSSSKNGNSPINNVLSEFTGGMEESGLFTQQPPQFVETDDFDKFDFKSVAEQKPVASIPPFSKASLEETGEPKFYESEDSSAKDSLHEDLPKKDEKPAIVKDPFEDFMSKKYEPVKVVSPPAPIVESKPPPVVESKPAPAAVVKPPEVTKVAEPPKPKQATPPPAPARKSAPSEPLQLTAEMELILNTLNPKAWFDPRKLHPTVSELVYWRDPKKSGVVFGSILVVLIAMTLSSLISVIAYVSLAILSGTFAFRVYKSVLQAIQKTNDGHPFKEYLDMDLGVPSDKAQEFSNAITNYMNTTLSHLRRLFLVEDIFESVKFGAFLYFLTYIGAWFNTLTLIILGVIAMFALPKVYETNKVVIDQYIDLVWGKLAEVNEKVTTALPFLAKKEKAQ